MSDLSFLPKEEGRQRTPLRWPRLVSAAVGAAVAGLAMWYASARIAAFYDMRTELAALTAEYEQLKPLLELQKKSAAAEKRLQEEEERVRPYRSATTVKDALEALNRSVPGGIVIQSFDLSPTREIKITGLAASLTDVARLMVALEASERFRSIGVRFPATFSAGASPGPGTAPVSPPPVAPAAASSSAPGRAPASASTAAAKAGTGAGAGPAASAAGQVAAMEAGDTAMIRFELFGFINTGNRG